MAFDLDVFIPTAKQPERTNNLICQINTALNCGLNTRVTIGMEGDYPGLLDNFRKEQLERIRIVTGVPQGTPSISIEHVLETTDWVDWVHIPADDDCVLPWGYQHLWEARKDVSMVLGQVLCVSRATHLDFSSYKVGRKLEVGFISGACALFNMRSMEKLPKPWMPNNPVSDFDMIKKMAENFPYTIIPNVVSVMSLTELESLHHSFQDHYKKIYGHLFP